LQNELNQSLTLLSSLHIYKLLLDFAINSNGLFILIIACMAQMVNDNALNIIISILYIVNLAIACYSTSQEPTSQYVPKRLRPHTTSYLSSVKNHILQSMRPVFNATNIMMTITSTRKHAKLRICSKNHRKQAHHGNTSRYTAKSKLLKQANFQIYQRSATHQLDQEPTANVNQTDGNTRKSKAIIPTIRKRLAQLWCLVAINQIAAPSTKHCKLLSTNLHQGDSDSFLIAIDNCCSRCITNSLEDFVSTPSTMTTSVRGLGANVDMTRIGTVKWSMLDNNGVNTDFVIPNVYYNANTPYRLFSPQHVAQELKRVDPCQTLSSTMHFDRVVITWDNGCKTKTIQLDPFSNVALTRSSPGYQQFAMYCAQIADDEHQVAFPTIDATNTAETSDIINENEIIDEPLHPDLPNAIVRQRMQANETQPDNPTIDELTDQSPQQIFDNETDVPQSDPTSQLLAWHYRMGHLSFTKLQQMAARGDLPASLAKCHPPKCASRMFGKATRRPTADKPSKSSKPPESFPGATVSVDHMLSSTPGLVGQMKGFLTRRRYVGACVFIDNYSNLSFIYFQKSLNIEETIEAKKAFKRYAASHGVRIKHYRADNGIFETAAFTNEVLNSGQSISYTGVWAHHQNGKAEKKIRDLQDSTRSMMLHAAHRFHNAIGPQLWPYAMKMANDMSNSAPNEHEGVSPLELFSQTTVAPKVRHSHTFGSPIYVLDDRLHDAGQTIGKWSQCSRIGIYLGTSPRHSRKVALVLSLETGHVSPQFHVTFDDYFETLHPNSGNSPPVSHWQVRTGFETTTKPTNAPSLDTKTETSINLLFSDPIPVAQLEQVLENPIPLVSDALNPLPANYTTRTGRTIVPTTKMKESLQQQIKGIVSLHVTWEVFSDDGYQIQTALEDPIAFAASNNPDVMHVNQALNAPDRENFITAMKDEVKAHTDNEHWVIVHRSQVPPGIKVLPAVWAMKRK
jgi:hypothetical protein